MFKCVLLKWDLCVFYIYSLVSLKNGLDGKIFDVKNYGLDGRIFDVKNYDNNFELV